METPDREKTAQFERLYSAVLLLLVAALLLLSILYTERLWGVKVGIALGLLGMSGFFLRRYAQGR